jgi:hypothetical protein
MFCEMALTKTCGTAGITLQQRMTLMIGRNQKVLR